MKKNNVLQSNKNLALDPALPILTSPVDPQNFTFSDGAGMWAAVKSLAENSDLMAQMDLAMEGQSAPRVWLMLHEPGESEWAAATAMAFAKTLGDRDQVALVLDCDDRGLALTRWANRFECEGWIDLARYGISLLAAGMELPFSGRRGYFLGVGSFAPTDVTADEIQTVMNRLRRQADDMILVAPADEIGKQWATAANIKLLCWDQAGRPASELGGLVNSLAAGGCQLTGLLGLGIGKPVAPMAEPEVPSVVSIAPERMAADSKTDIVTDEAEAEYERQDEPDYKLQAEKESESRNGTSGVFWFLATAAVVIVAIMGVYWFQYVREPSIPANDSRQVVAQLPSATKTPDSQIRDERLADDPVVGDMANGDDVEPDDISGGDTDASAAVDNSDQSVAPAIATEVGAATTGQEDALTSEAEIESPSAEPSFEMAPYQATVGAGGWALHLYSLNTESGAETEVTELNRRGFETEVRIVEKAGTGRLWRVYVGSFSSRIEARSASTLLKVKLKTDWANPTRF